MVFGLKKLQDELFCMTEERNYFQAKYTEQVSEIVHIKEELLKARREILKLRGELMESSTSTLLLGEDSLHDSSANFQTPPKNNRRRSRVTALEDHQEEKKDGEDSTCLPQQSASGAEDEGEHVDDDDDENETEDQEEEDEEEEHDDDEDTEAADIRQSAEKLLQWASYRSYARSSSANSPEAGSVASGSQGMPDESQSSASLLGPMIPRNIDSTSLKNSMSSESGETSPAGTG